MKSLLVTLCALMLPLGCAANDLAKFLKGAAKMVEAVGTKKKADETVNQDTATKEADVAPSPGADVSASPAVQDPVLTTPQSAGRPLKTSRGDIPRVDTRQKIALSHLIGQGDEIAFIKRVRLTSKAASYDEFGTSTGDQAEEEENRQALLWAKRVLSGDELLPAAVNLNLLRYNPENQSFIATDWGTELSLDINYPSAQITGVTKTSLQTLVIPNWKIFSSVKISPALAQKYLKDDSSRTVRVFGKFRLKQSTIKKCKSNLYIGNINDGEHSIEAELVEFDIGPANEKLWAEYAGAMDALPYQRTATELEWAARLGGKSFFGDQNGYHFLEDGRYLRMHAAFGDTPDGKVRALASAAPARWFVLNGKLYLVKVTDAPVDFELDGAVLRLDGIPYRQDPRLKVSGNRITYD